jgi:hypothetical protein
MLPTGPVLPQAQVFDLLGCPTHLQPSLGELQLDVEHLHLVEELVDLRRRGLTLLVKGAEAINFCHISPIVLGERVESLTECSERRGRSRECGEEPPRESPRCLVGSPTVDWGIQVDDDGKVIQGIPVGVLRHPALIQASNPPSRAVVFVATGDFNPDLSPVLDIPARRVGEWLLHDWGRSCCGCGLMFLHEEALHMVEVTPTLHGESQTINELLQEVWVEVFICLDDVLHGLRGQGPPLYLGNKRSLGGVTPNPSDEVLEDPCIEVGVILDPLLDLFDGEGPRTWDGRAIPPEPFGQCCRGCPRGGWQVVRGTDGEVRHCWGVTMEERMVLFLHTPTFLCGT